MALTQRQRREGAERGLHAHDSLANFLQTGKAPDAAATSMPIADAVVMDAAKIFPTPPGEPGWKVSPRRKADHGKHLELMREIQEAHARGLGINGTGIWQPIIVRRTSDPNVFYITAGARRWRAAREAGLTKVPVIVRDQSTVDAYETALVENLLREDMTVADTAHALLNWMQEADLSIREMARRTGKSAPAISTAIGVVKDPVLSKAVEDGKITPSQAREMLAVKGPPRLKLVDSVSERRAAGVSVPLPQLRQEVKAAQAPPVTLRNAPPLTGQAQGTYTPPQPQIDPVDMMLKVSGGARAAANVLPTLKNAQHLYRTELKALIALTRQALDEMEAVGTGK